MNDISIQRTTVADATNISKVLFDSFIQFKSFYTDKAFAATTISPGEVKKRMKEGNVWIALKSNIIIGTVAVIKKEEGLYIRGMAVLPEARGSKTGWKLLETIQEYAVENNFKSLSLSTTPYLTSAIHLYKKFGFTQIGEMDDSFYGTLIIQMKKEI
ncbi:MAG: GNAT family N-acetyltransferase [Ginsengibacter sp.]